MFDNMILNRIMSKQYFNILYIDLKNLKTDGDLHTSDIVSQLVSSIDGGHFFQFLAPVKSAEERLSAWGAVQDIQPIRTSVSENDAYICVHFDCESFEPPFKVLKTAISRNPAFKDLTFDILSYEKAFKTPVLFHARASRNSIIKKAITPPFSRNNLKTLPSHFTETIFLLGLVPYDLE